MPESEQKMPEPEPEMSEKDEKVTAAVSLQENPTLNDFAPDIPKPEEAEEPDGKQSPEPCTENEPEEQEEQLPGQISIEEMPEVLPKAEPEKSGRQYLTMLNTSLEHVKRLAGMGMWGSAMLELKTTERYLKLLIDGEK
jgi:hypothetical protein